MLLDFAEILVDVWMSGKDARNGLQLHRKTCEIFEPPLLPNIIVECHRSLQILDCPNVRWLRLKCLQKFNQSLWTHSSFRVKNFSLGKQLFKTS